MSAVSDRRLGWNSVDTEDEFVNVWMIPLWLKSNYAIKCVVSPQTARKWAIQLLQAADRAEAKR